MHHATSYLRHCEITQTVGNTVFRSAAEQIIPEATSLSSGDFLQDKGQILSIETLHGSSVPVGVLEALFGKCLLGQRLGKDAVFSRDVKG